MLMIFLYIDIITYLLLYQVKIKIKFKKTQRIMLSKITTIPKKELIE
jgi:hypothetical protein